MTGYQDTQDPVALLNREPDTSGGPTVEQAVQDAGIEVQAVDWVWRKVVGESLVKTIVEPITGDFEKIAKQAGEWENVCDALQAVRNNLNSGLQELDQAWTGDAAQAFKGLIGNQWTLAIEADAQAAKLIGIALNKVADGSNKACGKILDLIKKLVDKLIEAAAMLPIPVVGWARAVKLVYDGIELYNAIMSLINGIKSIIEGAQQVIQGIKQVGSALSKLKDVRNLNDLVNVANETGEGVATAKGGVDNIKDGFGDVKDGATSAASAASNAHTHAHEPTNPHGNTDKGSNNNGDGTVPASTTTKPGDPNSTPKNDPNASPNRPADPNATRTPDDWRPCENDPVDVATGDVVLTQLDAELLGVLPLVLRRTHVSSYRAGRSFGRSWASTLDQRLEVDREGAVFVAEDGMLLVYPTQGVGETVLPQAGPRWPLTRSATGYELTQHETGRTLHFPERPTIDRPLTAVVDRNGNRIDFDRAPGDVVTAVRHSGGYRVDVLSDAGRVTELRLNNPAGRDVTLVKFGHDDAGNLATVTNSSDRPLVFTYDSDGRITQWTDRNGRWYRYLYDQNGRCIANEGSDGFLNGTFVHDPVRRTTRFTNALGNTTIYLMDERHNVVAVTDPLGNTTTSVWDEHNQLVSRTDPLGRTTRRDFDADGRLVRVVRPDGTESRAQYNAFGQPTTVVDADGSTWRQEYDECGNLVARTDPAGFVRRYEYTKAGHLVRAVNEAGAVRTVRTDAAGLPVEITDPLGAQLRHVRDPFGRIAETIDPLGGRTRYQWSIEGRMIARTAPNGGTEQWRFDGEGAQLEFQDASGAVSRTITTHFDLPRLQTLPDGSTLAFSYDTNLNLTRVTNGAGQSWVYEYDAADRLVRETDFAGRPVSYEYDAAGQLVARVNGAGERWEYARDAMGKVTRKQSGDLVSEFEFDAMGRLVRAVNADAEVTMTRDPLGRVVAEAVNGRVSTYGYDPAGNRVLRRLPSGSETTWQYDANRRPVAMSTAGRTMTFAYDGSGHEVRRQVDAVTFDQSWDPTFGLTGQTITSAAGTVRQRRFRYRFNSQLTAIEDQLDGDRTLTLDDQGRVTAVDGPSWQERYRYDATGNLAEASWPGGDDTAGDREYVDNRLVRAGSTRFQHDRNGRVVLRQAKRLSHKPATWRYTWNAEDRLTGVVTPDGTRWRYRYDALGRRIAKQRLTEHGEVAAETTFCWDGDVLAEQTESGGTTTCWTYHRGSYKPLTQVVRRQDQVDEQFFAIVTDLVGTPTELLDTDGNVAWHQRRSVWGHVVGTSGADGVEMPLRFPGQYHDPETGWHYNFHRYYDPESARYVSTDPLGLTPSANPNAYVNNPFEWLDPLGLAPCNTYHATRDDALNAAYDRAGIPRGTEPDQVWEVGDDHNRHGDPNYRYSEDRGSHGVYRQFETDNGSRVIAEHTNDPNAPGPHFHAGEPKGDPSRNFVDFGWSDAHNRDVERYGQMGGKHHIFYGVTPPS
ncbi:DUF6531 domain-containing protein [Labedaea rhizosphaerae]|uniref:RHS repeat-associated protein n=1 Tax=Labedaea rhizosphaerae TaxID=598644 RepID=A0A4R6SGT7_LABRH|nr:DUF6531 domain-containing protein [Labedaea rhizosphaerae]TDQ00954.1 RHS repeat-associated protein [Labedaea rhizosphaerae]